MFEKRGETEKKYLRFAEKYYMKVLKINPNHAPSYNGLGLVYDALKDREKALRYFDKALKVEEDNAIFLHNKGCCLRRMEKYEESLKYLYQALKLDPQNCQIYSSIGYSTLYQISSSENGPPRRGNKGIYERAFF